MKRFLRLASLLVPSWLAWYVAFSAPHRAPLVRTVTAALYPLWILIIVAIVLRGAVILRNKQKLAELDILTAGGVALAWFSAFSIMGAVWIGWASLAAVGLLGTGVFHAAVLLGFATMRLNLKQASIERKLTAESISEGDDVTEEIQISNLPIPIGYRAFITGRIAPRWTTSRYTLEASESNAEIVLESELGTAIRTDVVMEPLEIWLADTFGICRTRPAQIPTDKRVVVTPKLRAVDKTVPLLQRGIGPRISKQNKMPTEGVMNIREYQQGDDIRRVHWVRSLASGGFDPNKMVVRMPDEVPPDRPRVRLVLDTYFPEVFAFSCDAPWELLDKMVAAWLSVARDLAESGVLVTLVATVQREGQPIVLKIPYDRRSPMKALKIGCEIAWQNCTSVDSLLTDEAEAQATFVVSRSVSSADQRCKWILVPPQVAPDLGWPFPSAARLMFPMGASDNRRRGRAMKDFVQIRGDHARAMLLLHAANATAPTQGSFAAITTADGSLKLEVVA